MKANHGSFTYEEYSDIIIGIRERIPILDYADINSSTEEYCIIRHDIEFSIERALSLATLEFKLGVKTSYFVQLNNNTYNTLSKQSKSMLTEILSMGHSIGLHYQPSSEDFDEIESELRNSLVILENHLGVKIDRFSFHRPNLYPNLIKNTLKLDGLINVYDDLFFTFSDNLPSSNLKIKYLSDSNHKWKYGYPLEEVKKGCRKIQILAHPFSWSINGGNNLENYISLIDQKKFELLESMNLEMSNFPYNQLKKQF